MILKCPNCDARFAHTAVQNGTCPDCGSHEAMIPEIDEYESDEDDP